MTSFQLPRILVVDHFDSYTLNLLSLLHPVAISDGHISSEHRDELTRRISDRVIVLPHTHPLLAPAAFHELVRPHIDAIILSPGPGSPDKAADFGAAETLLKDQSLNLPVLGVCLGHQGLAVAFGGQITRAISVRHGLQSKLKISQPSSSSKSPRSHVISSILDSVPQDALVVRYNSLVVDPETLPDCLKVTAWSYDQVSSAPPPRPGNTKKAATSPVPLRPTSDPIAQLKHREMTSLSRTPSTLPVSSRNGSERLSEVGDMPLSEATSMDDDADPATLVALEQAPTPAIMALQHKTLPFHGVQFHPESIESHWGHAIMSNFLSIVRQYWNDQTSGTDAETSSDAFKRVQGWDSPELKLPGHLTLASERCLASDTTSSAEVGTGAPDVKDSAFTLLAQRLPSLPTDHDVDMVRVFDQLFRHSSPAGAVWLDSARLKDPHSRYSFMALPSFIMSYTDGADKVVVSGDEKLSVDVPFSGAKNDTFWSFMNELQAQLQSSIDFTAADNILDDDQRGHLFRTGFCGYWGYEMKNESLQLETRAPTGDSRNAFDAEFLHCPRALAFDHHLHQWTAFALVASSSSADVPGPLGQINSALHDLQDDGKQWCTWALAKSDAECWMQETLANVLALCKLPKSPPADAAQSAAAFRAAMPLLRPRMLAEDYMDQIETARELIAAGESYELCMTNQFQGQLAPLASLRDAADTDHFDLYCKLRARNPAPYSAFIRLPSLQTNETESSSRKRGRAILSTSPERFMRITADGQVEMKPIKGTLARAGFGPGEHNMRACANGTPAEEFVKQKWRESEDEARRARLSADVKERAENLMIVDLIRADLFSFCRSDSVAVPKLMQVESYETVHQLVTTVTGQLKASVGTTEAIRRCFPPGSMTGAPKRRSVQLLERLELNLADAERDDALRARRGIYSGALGWLGCDGAADFAVVIRTLVADGDDVSIGAGGAITYLSDAEKEWQEVLDKVTALANIEA
ncbi:Anthranilate synthase component I, N-terminal [Kalmanozyma brasiliensis GHG001]|uniref:Anthranilate synthase component I, N-terminal n=1 Tax=Kalmanozyma brasiliensis (strain GHG001) TaxID=1365824 RepID=UPI001CE8067D|nr:Anthranilate synthase component I, N-terminal [Kalmanozyma brasiliensis GHG001]EST07973.2 Anthranilate synthase component I, N-terminal [Kalmanozyma brasiliensis GHG001]